MIAKRKKVLAAKLARSAVARIILFSSVAFCQVAANLHTRETSIQLEASTSTPHLMSLAGRGAKTWINLADEPLIPFVWVGETRVTLQWKLNRSRSQSNASLVRFTYDASPVPMRLIWEWQARAANGPIEHRIHIENRSPKEIWIPLQDSMRFDWKLDGSRTLQSMYIDKGAGKPTEIGTHHQLLPIGYRWEGRSSTYATDASPREIIPFVMVEDAEAKNGWYAGVEFSGRTRISLNRDTDYLHGVIGLNPIPGPFRTRLAPMGSFDTPPVFLGAFTGGADGLGNVLRPWVRRVLTHAETWENSEYPLLVNNSWGSGMQVDEVLAEQMIRESAELGLEMFHLDAGWFRGVGDWYPNRKKFPHGLATISDYAHAHGIKFGIWVNWAEAGIDKTPGALNVHDPKVKDWLIAEVPVNWIPKPFVGRTIDLGAPAVHDYAEHEVERIVHDYHIDMLEHDGYVVAKGCVRRNHPHAPPSSGIKEIAEASGVQLPEDFNSTDVSYHSVRSYYEIYAHLRQQHPDLLLEICNDGGRMVDFGTAAHGDYFSITDSYDPLSNRRAFYDASYVLPASMLEDYVARWPTPTIGNFLYMLRSGMMGWLTIMQDTNTWTTEQHAAAREEFGTYKQFLRPLIRDADLYHISARPDGVHWDGIEYFNPKLGKGVIYAFRGSIATENDHTFTLRGLDLKRKYRLTFHDRSASDLTATGRKLIQTGLAVNLPEPDSSELVFVTQVDQ